MLHEPLPHYGVSVWRRDGVSKKRRFKRRTSSARAHTRCLPRLLGGLLPPLFPFDCSPSQEASFATNVARLKEYRANLIVFPRGAKHQPKEGDSSLEEQAAATQVTTPIIPGFRCCCGAFTLIILHVDVEGWCLAACGRGSVCDLVAFLCPLLCDSRTDRV